jgi:glycosyltransferase involved in cell wall biosynthesis
MDKISVIIPTIGRSRLLDCLRSLEKQSMPPSEILIIDNSRDRKAQVIVDQYLNKNGHRVRYIHENKEGVHSARNRGIFEAKNDLICFIDDDCVAEKNWTLELYNAIKMNKKSIIRGENMNGDPNNLFACVEYFDEQMFFKKDFFIKKKNIISFWLDSKNFIISKKLIKKNKIVFRDYEMGEDLDFSLQAITKKIPVLYCQKACIYHFGRADFFHHIIREIKKGREAKKLSKYWNSQHNPILTKTMLNKQIIWKKWRENSRLENELIAEIFIGKKLLFKISFRLLLTINHLINNIFFYIP